MSIENAIFAKTPESWSYGTIVVSQITCSQFPKRQSTTRGKEGDEGDESVGHQNSRRKVSSSLRFTWDIEWKISS